MILKNVIRYLLLIPIFCLISILLFCEIKIWYSDINDVYKTFSLIFSGTLVCGCICAFIKWLDGEKPFDIFRELLPDDTALKWIGIFSSGFFFLSLLQIS